MYKIYINDIPFILTQEQNIYDFPEGMIVRPFLGHTKIFLDHIYFLEKQKKPHPGVALITENIEETFTQFKSLFTILEAAGGVVENTVGEILFIFRRGFWDLPKGKIEHSEVPRVTALREVSEETGLSEIEVVKEICITYHTYHIDSERILKPTHWFFMRNKEVEPSLIPQKSEEITDVRWMKKSHFLEKYKKHTYASILEVVNTDI